MRLRIYILRFLTLPIYRLDSQFRSCLEAQVSLILLSALFLNYMYLFSSPVWKQLDPILIQSPYKQLQRAHFVYHDFYNLGR